MTAEKKAGEDVTPVLLLLSAAFLLGGIAGCLLEGARPTSSVVDVFLSGAVHGMTRPATPRELWVLLRWPIAALCAGYLPGARAAMPVLFFLRGLCLSYGISALVGTGGSAGWLGGVMLFGPACLLAVPAFFVIGATGLLRREKQTGPGRQALTAALSIPALLLCALLDLRVTPLLLPALLQTAAGS